MSSFASSLLAKLTSSNSSATRALDDDAAVVAAPVAAAGSNNNDDDDEGEKFNDATDGVSRKRRVTQHHDDDDDDTTDVDDVVNYCNEEVDERPTGDQDERKEASPLTKRPRGRLSDEDDDEQPKPITPEYLDRVKRALSDQPCVYLEGPSVATAEQAATIAGTECPICFEMTSDDDGYCLIGCEHFFCKDCLHGHIKAKLSEKAVGPKQLVCPHTATITTKTTITTSTGSGRRGNTTTTTSTNTTTSTCKTPLDTTDVRACTYDNGDLASWREYEEIATQIFLDQMVAGQQRGGAGAGEAASNNSGDDDDDDAGPASAGGDGASSAGAQQQLVRRCPSEHCNFVFHNDLPPYGSGQLFICPTCHEAYCLHCPAVGGHGMVGPAHDDKCSRVVEQLRYDEEKRRKLGEWQDLNTNANDRFQQLINRERDEGVTKACPHCNTLITKNDGCDHMHCIQCDEEFDWSEAQ